MVLINNSQITTNNFGIVADGTGTTGKINGSVRDTTINGNNQNGITASASTAAGDTLVLNNVSSINNGNNGLAASGSMAGLLVGNSTIYGNHGGIAALNSSVIDSYGNNQLNGNNGADGLFVHGDDRASIGLRQSTPLTLASAGIQGRPITLPNAIGARRGRCGFLRSLGCVLANT